MSKHTVSYKSVMALYPSNYGYGFALFRAPLSPIVWGLKDIRQKPLNAHCLRSISNLLTECRPEAIVLANWKAKPQRTTRIKQLHQAVVTVARSLGADVHRFSRAQVRAAFADIGVKTKYEIAGALAHLIPELSPRMPRKRKAWTAEDARMALFDAAALAFTFFESQAAMKERAA